MCGHNSQSEGIWKSHIGAEFVDYQNNIKCTTVFTAESGKVIRFTESFQQTETCCDSASLYDGPTTSYPLLTRLIGTAISPPYSWITTGNTLTINFITDGSVVFPGIVAQVDFITAVPSEAPRSSLGSTVTVYSSYSSSPQLSISPSPSDSIASVSSSSTSSQTVSPSASAVNTKSLLSSLSPSSSQSGSPSSSQSGSQSSSSTASQTNSPTFLTESPYQTYSILDTLSPMSSLTYTYTTTQSIAAAPSSSAYYTHTPQYSFTISPSISSSAQPSAHPRGPPPPLPENLANLSLGALNGLFNDIALYDPLTLQSSLNALGSAALKQSGGEFGISTSAFSLKMKALNASSTAALQVGSTSLSLPPLSTLGIGLAASMVQWTSNPYASLSSIVSDTLPLSLNILDSGGGQLNVKNLTNPIQFSWSLNASDTRFQVAPFYLARCDLNTLYMKNGYTYDIAKTAIQTVNGSWSVPCLLGSWLPLNCTSFEPFSFANVQCPDAVLTPDCLHWNSNTSSWSSEGCTPTISGLIVTCSCTHLTDFTTRIGAMAQANKDLFANAANVYSASGLVKFAEWFGIFGGIAALTIILGLLAARIDYLTTSKYVTQLCRDETVRTVFDNAPNSAIYIFDPKSTKRCTKAFKAPVKVDKNINVCTRICQQHSRIQFLFRYDPRLARIFRLLTLFTIQYHSLFISALFYGFTYGGSGKEGMMWYDVLALSIITSMMNVPVISIVLSSLNKIGLSEFKYKFPLLFEEFTRRSRFEKYAMKYLSNKKESSDSDNEQMVEGLGQTLDNSEESIIELILMYLCCKSPKNEDEHDNNEINRLSQKDLLIRMIKIIKAKYRGFEVYNPAWSMLPCHSVEAWIFLICSSGWLAWCLNYLLLFAASHPSDVGEKIMISYATSELTTIFLTQPLSIIFTYGLFKLSHTYSSYIPKILHRFFIISSKNNIPSAYFFSNPWAHMTETQFSAKFAYSLFVRCPAIASNASELAYAPTKAIIHDLESGEPCEVERLYSKILIVNNSEKESVQLR